MNNINERMAKVMGWHRGKDKNKEYSDRYYSKEGGNPIIWVSDSGMPRTWHPDTSIEQAMMVARKIIETEHKFYTIVKLSLYPNGIDVTIEKYKLRASDSDYPVHKWLAVGEIGEEAKAICEAILETMDENNIIPLNLDMEDKDE